MLVNDLEKRALMSFCLVFDQDPRRNGRPSHLVNDRCEEFLVDYLLDGQSGTGLPQRSPGPRCLRQTAVDVVEGVLNLR